MTSVKDADLIIEYVLSCWPEFHITKEMMINPTSEFAVRFYKNLIADFNDKIGFLMNEEVVLSEFDDNQDFEPEVYLFCKVAKLYQKLNSMPITLADITQPTPKRNATLMKMGIHFLIYLNNNIDEIANVVGDAFAQAVAQKELQDKKQELVQEANETAENSAKLDDEHDKLMAKLESVKKEHAKMLDQKKSKNKVNAGKVAEIERLTKTRDDLVYNLKHKEEEETVLQGQIVTEDDFKALKDTEERLLKEKSELSSCDVDLGDGMDEQKKVLDHLCDCAAALKGIDFEELPIQKLNNTKEQMCMKTKQLEKLQKKLRELENRQKNLEKDTKLLSDKLEACEVQLVGAQKNNEVELEQLKDELDKKVTEHERQLEINMMFKERIRQEEEEISVIQNNRKVLIDHFTLQYKKVLDAHRHTVNNFNDQLLCVKEKGSQC